jgi:hypothetical protein
LSETDLFFVSFFVPSSKKKNAGPQIKAKVRRRQNASTGQLE